MKKIIAIVLLAALTLSLAACGTINKSDVAVLWSGADTAQIPNSLINAMDRAMYIENLGYTYYGAEGDAAKQLTQAQEALDAGCAALMVELVDPASAQQIVDLAKAKDVPVIFFGCDVDKAVTESYGKCVVVSTDPDTLATAYFDMVSEYVLKNTEVKKSSDDDLDLNDDGKISYVTVGEIALTESTAVEKNKDGEPKLEKDGSYTKAVELVKLDVAFEALETVEESKKSGLFGGTTTYRHLQTADGDAVELILAADDQQAMTVLLALQERKLNANELATCFVPVFTVGNEVDYKAYVLENAPEDAEALKAHYEANKFLVDLTTVKEEDLAAMIYTTVNVIDSGRITGTVMEDYDAIAVAAAEACAALVTGKGVEKAVIEVPYTAYAG